MKQIGKMAWCMTETGFEAYGLALLTRFGGFSMEQAKGSSSLSKLSEVIKKEG